MRDLSHKPTAHMHLHTYSTYKILGERSIDSFSQGSFILGSDDDGLIERYLTYEWDGGVTWETSDSFSLSFLSFNNGTVSGKSGRDIMMMVFVAYDLCSPSYVSNRW